MGLLAIGWALSIATGNDAVPTEERLTVVVNETPLRLGVLLSKGVAYVPLAPVVEALNAEIKRTGENQIGICPTEDICAFVRTDGSDDRIAVVSGDYLVALSAIPELLQTAFGWSASHGALALVPCKQDGTLRLSPGDLFPDIVLPNMEGNPFSFSSSRGRKTVLFTWASW